MVTSGGQVLASVADLRTAGARVSHAVCVIERGSGGRGALAEAGVELRSLFTPAELGGAIRP